PVKITLMRTKNGVVEAGRNFSADDDWLQGLEIHAVNESAKTVTYIGIELTFRRTEDQERGMPAGWPFEYGLDPFWFEHKESMPPPQVEAVLPGRSVTILLSDKQYDEIKSFLKSIGFPNSVKRLEVRVIKIGFSDGTAWNAGRIYQRLP